MKIIKRNGQETDFNPAKILRVINLANNSVAGTSKIQSEEAVQKIYNFVLESLSEFNTVSVETIQDKIRDAFMNFNYFEVADTFIKYRQDKTNKKKFTDSEEKIISTCNYSNEAVKQDNANKNPRLLSVQRDYIAGISCKDIARKTLPKDIIEAHDRGLIHYHDMDYSPLQKMSNCCLVNFKDMRENGFSMNSISIHQTTKGFLTDCTLASQASAQVAGQQYGGQTMSWAHIAKSISITRNRILKELVEDGIVKSQDQHDGTNLTTKDIEELYGKEVSDLVEKKVQREITTGVKTVQYQILTILCSNGQTPFISMSMNLEDCEEDKQWEEDTKRVFEEVFKQRIKGIPDEKGNYVPVVFPKLLYFLDERNYKPGTENWWLTQLAAKSAAKTMAPDFISSKVQKKLKHTKHTWPCMGCVSGDSIIKIEYKNEIIEDAFINIWNLLSNDFEIKEQFGLKGNPNVEMNLTGVKIFDNKENSFVDCFKIIKNKSTKWTQVEFSKNGYRKILQMTIDHKMTLLDGTEKSANELRDGDIIFDDWKITNLINYNNENGESFDVTTSTEHFEVNGLYSHNCRSFATPFTPPSLTSTEKVGFNEGYEDTYTVAELYQMSKEDPKHFKYRMFLRKEGFYEGDVNEIDHFEETGTGEILLICRPKFWGFFNGGVVTINIPYIALESKGNKTEFWKLLDQRCELVYKALIERYKSLKNAPSDAAPILRQHGALMRVGNKNWNHMIIGPRCTYSLGYAGLWETQLYMTGKKLSEDQSFANEILNFFNKKHSQWRERLADSAAVCEYPEVWVDENEPFELCN